MKFKWITFSAIAIILLPAPFYAQRGSSGGGPAPHGPTGRPTTGTTGTTRPGVWNSGGCSNNPGVWASAGCPSLDNMQTMGDNSPVSKPVIADDEKCLPWNVSEVRATAVSVARLKVPSGARKEFEKACDANNKNNFTEAEQHVRSAVEKFPSYAAAWVMLGVILEEQHKKDEAIEACSHSTSVDSTYLPGYLCRAEFESRAQEWDQVLNLANLSLGLNSEGDAYAYYYRAMAYFHMNNMVEAKKSAVAAEEVDVTHKQVTLFFLLAQIYEAQGETANAEAQLRLVLKHHQDKDQEEAAKQYLAKLGAQGADAQDSK